MNLRQLRAASKALHHQLNQKNDYKMTEAIRYLRDKDLTVRQLETLRHMLLEKALASQQQGKPAEAAFGYDYRSYIDELVAGVPPMTAAQRRYEGFRLWGFLILAMLAISMGQHLAGSLLTDTPMRWQVRAFELLLFLLIAGLSAILTNLFSRFRLERDQDFFTKKEGSRFADFFRTYGLGLIWALLMAALMFLFRDRLLWDLPMSLAAGIFAAAAAGYFLISAALRRAQDD